MTEIGPNSILSTSSASSKEQDPKKLREAAKQFEAMLIEQMLKAAKASGSGDWSGTSDDPTSATMSDMAEQQFAQALAASGGLGLAKMVVERVERK